LLDLVREKHAKARLGARAFQFGVGAFIWLLGLGTAVETVSITPDAGSLALFALLGLIVVGGTAVLAWATCRWLHRLWVRMKVAELRESRVCYRCDYPIPSNAGEEPRCPECGLVNDLRERTWWRAKPPSMAEASRVASSPG
jgi:predicted RNA-binding Zn-ribbon protein involved in translation (DUF1610 family)